jgi:predicted nucleic acid-binding protein
VSACVVDASVVAKWFLDEECSEESRCLLTPEHQLHAPDFLLTEMDHLLCKRVRRGDLRPEDADEARRLLDQLPITFHPTLVLRENAYRLAMATGQSVYDCLYVALAQVLGAPLVTADLRLHRALAGGPLGHLVQSAADLP